MSPKRPALLVFQPVENQLAAGLLLLPKQAHERRAAGKRALPVPARYHMQCAAADTHGRQDVELGANLGLKGRRDVVKLHDKARLPVSRQRRQ